MKNKSEEISIFPSREGVLKRNRIALLCVGWIGFFLCHAIAYDAYQLDYDTKGWYSSPKSILVSDSCLFSANFNCHGPCHFY